MLNDATHNQEYDIINELPLESIRSCHHFINKVLEILITNKRKYAWYMQPIAAETMTLGEVLIGVVILVIVSILLHFH